MTAIAIEATKICKAYGDHVVLHDVDPAVKEGEVAAIIGPSGAGKSTFLRCLNLLDERPNSFDIQF